jgi:hypothetical protein
MSTIGRFSPNKVRARILDNEWVEPLGGMVLMTPTSVATTGTSSTATIGTNGSVAFSSCATLSLNGVFNTDYDNYMISIRHTGSGSIYIQGRLLTGGSEASGSNYVSQYLYASGTSVAGARYTSQTIAYLSSTYNTQRSGVTVNVYGPFLAQPTAFRSITALDFTSAYIEDYASTHSLSTSYDGIKLITSAGTFSGLVSVYGLVGT